MSDYVYHGRSPSDGRKWANSRGGYIDGSTFDIYNVEIPPPDDAKDYRARGIEDLPGTVVGKESVDIAGGLTANIGAAIKFHKSLSELGAVFIIDRGRLSHEVERIQYDFEWAEDHPGIYARIDSIDDFEVFEYGDLIGAGYYNESDYAIINRWGDQLRDRINNFAFQDEAELICYECDRLQFGDALVGTATYAHTKRSLGGSIQGALAEYPGYSMGFGGGIQDMDPAEMAQTFAEEFGQAYGGPGSVFGDDHRVVLYDHDAQRIRDEVAHIPEDAFVLAATTDEIIRDPSRVSAYL